MLKIKDAKIRLEVGCLREKTSANLALHLIMLMQKKVRERTGDE